MLKNKKWIILIALGIVFLGVYLWPVPSVPFEKTYEKVNPSQSQALHDFRINHPVQNLNFKGENWKYVSFGKGEETILFLHGMTGAYDIWWNQMEALQDTYRVISVTYPAVDSLEEMSDGVLAILDAEGVEKTNIVGTSLGGYLAQYMVANHPDRVLAAVFSNTFPPNDLIAEKNRSIGMALPFLPEWLVLDVLRGSFSESIYPASGKDELTLAFLNEISYGRMRKAQVVGRFHGVVEKFTPPDVVALDIPVLIIEADNDPLVELTLREQLKETYPTAEVWTLSEVGHFPYLNFSEAYTNILKSFFGNLVIIAPL